MIVLIVVADVHVLCMSCALQPLHCVMCVHFLVHDHGRVCIEPVNHFRPVALAIPSQVLSDMVRGLPSSQITPLLHSLHFSSIFVSF